MSVVVVTLLRWLEGVKNEEFDTIV